LCEVGTKDEQKKFANLHLFLKIHSHYSSVVHVLMLASHLRKKGQNFHDVHSFRL
jgi:hypothetical protein